MRFPRSRSGVSRSAFSARSRLDGVDLTIMPGEIHALVGENGAGKSTLIKILAGLYQPDSGEILVNGRRVHPHSESVPISFVHQDLGLVDELSIGENVALVAGFPQVRRPHLLEQGLAAGRTDLWRHGGRSAESARSCGFAERRGQSHPRHRAGAFARRPRRRPRRADRLAARTRRAPSVRGAATPPRLRNEHPLREPPSERTVRPRRPGDRPPRWPTCSLERHWRRDA